MNVRDTANIDVVNRPPSRLEHQPRQTSVDNQPKEASRPPVGNTAIHRDFTVGTLKRGRKVIRLQTTRLPSPESIATPKEEPKVTAPVPIISPSVIREEQEEASPRTRPAVSSYGGAERTALPVSRPIQKKTPGEKLKEKYMVLSRKGPKKATVVGLHQRLLASSSAVPTAVAASVVPAVPLLSSQDSGLGSSPAITAPTSFRDAKLTDGHQSRNLKHNNAASNTSPTDNSINIADGYYPIAFKDRLRW